MELCDSLREEHIPEDVFVHFDTPLTWSMKGGGALLRRRGFSEVVLIEIA